MKNRAGEVRILQARPTVRRKGMTRSIMVQEMNEPIDVLSVFREGKVQPLKFKWAGRTYPVSRIAYSWTTRKGAHPIHHFSLMAGTKDVYEILFDSYTMVWMLSRVHLEESISDEVA